MPASPSRHHAVASSDGIRACTTHPLVPPSRLLVRTPATFRAPSGGPLAPPGHPSHGRPYTSFMGEGIEQREDQLRGDDDQPTVVHSALRRRTVLGVAVVIVTIGILVAVSRGTTSALVPDLVGERVDPQLDGLRLRLATAGLVLGDVSTAPCPSADIPGASLEELPGTIVDQHPAAGREVAEGGAVDVAVCLPDETTSP